MLEEPPGCDATELKAVVAVDASAAVPATFPNVRLDIFLLIKVDLLALSFLESIREWTNRLDVQRIVREGQLGVPASLGGRNAFRVFPLRTM
jgi:hypothetical protein